MSEILDKHQQLSSWLLTCNKEFMDFRDVPKFMREAAHGVRESIRTFGTLHCQDARSSNSSSSSRRTISNKNVNGSFSVGSCAPSVTEKFGYVEIGALTCAGSGKASRPMPVRAEARKKDTKKIINGKSAVKGMKQPGIRTTYSYKMVTLKESPYRLLIKCLLVIFQVACKGYILVLST